MVDALDSRDFDRFRARLADEAVQTGTYTGPVRMGGQVRPPTGGAVCLPECVTFEVRDRRLVRMTSCADRLDAFAQLGLLSGDG